MACVCLQIQVRKGVFEYEYGLYEGMYEFVYELGKESGERKREAGMGRGDDEGQEVFEF